MNAARDPWVWAPLAGAAACRSTTWIGARRTGLANTRRYSARNVAPSSGATTCGPLPAWPTTPRSLATPSGDDFGEWLANKGKGHAGRRSSCRVQRSRSRDRSRKTVGRTRPNGQDEESFPSGHTSSSAVHTRLASRNLRSIDMPDGARRTLDVGLYALTIGTSWSRIEAGWHFPPTHCSAWRWATSWRRSSTTRFSAWIPTPRRSLHRSQAMPDGAIAVAHALGHERKCASCRA